MQFTLTRPIIGPDDKPHKTITVREHMTIGDMLAARRESVADESIHDLVLVARLVGWSHALMEQLDINDYEALVKHAVSLKKDSTTPASGAALPSALGSGDQAK